ncbi:MAG: hypothetical protein H7Y18_17915 [Clostridiaceae bacterium]|nr:hypothetical protein [Clostridiaceae bacterium]
MMMEVFKRELIFEFPRARGKKSIIAFIGIGTLSYTLLQNSLSVNQLSVISIMAGISAINFYTAVLYMLSKLKGRYIKLWYSLPINKKSYITVLILISYIKYFVLRLLPFALAMIYILVTRKEMHLFKSIMILLFLSTVAFIATTAGGLLAILINKTNRFEAKGKKRVYEFNVRSLSINLIIREWQSFRKDRLLLINHIAFGAFSIFFIYNASINANGIKATSLLALSLMFTSSTASVSYSKDKEVIKLIKVLPIEPSKIFIAKYLFNLLIAIPVYACGVLLVGRFQETLLEDLIIYSLVSAFLTTFIKLYVDYITPILAWQHVKQIFENKRKYVIWTMVILITAPSIFLGSMNIFFVIILQTICTVVLTAIYTAYQKKQIIMI